jgi:hypothetical protein
MGTQSAGILLGLRIMLVRLLGSHPLLIEHDGEGLEVIKVVGLLANHELLDLKLETIVEHGDKDGFVMPSSFQDQFLKLFDIPVDGAGLSDHVGKLVLGLLLGVQVSPFEVEILLEEFPAHEVVRNVILLIHGLQLDVLPGHGFFSTKLQCPSDADADGHGTVMDLV